MTEEITFIEPETDPMELVEAIIDTMSRWKCPMILDEYLQLLETVKQVLILEAKLGNTKNRIFFKE